MHRLVIFFTLIQTQSSGYFCLNVAPQRIPRPPLKTSATDFTWRQRLNEYGSMHFNKCHISFGFATLLPKRRLAQNLKKKKKKYTFLCGILPKFALNHNTACWHNTIQVHEVANCVITELDNIIVEQQDPHTAHGQDLYDSVNHATSEPYNIKKSSFVTSIFSGAAKTSLSLYCMSHGLNVAILS